MATLARITMLGLCVAAGLAAAYGVAVYATQLPPNGRLTAVARTVAESAGEPRDASEAEPLRPIPDPQHDHTDAWVSRESVPTPAAQPAADQLSPGAARFPTPAWLAEAQPSRPVIGLVSTPVVTEYQPPVADPFGAFRDVLREIQDKQARAERALTRIEQDLPREVAPAEASIEAIDAPEDQPEKQTPPPPLPPPRVARGDGDFLEIDLVDQPLRGVLNMLGQAGGFNVLASPTVTGNVTATLVDVEPEEALRAILRATGFVSRKDGPFVFVGTAAELQAMDQADSTIKTRVYRLNYVSAAELQNLISPLMTEQGSVTISSPAEVGVPTDEVNAGGNSFAGDEVLVIRDYEFVLAEIDMVAAEIDVMPLQVMLEATILSVRLDDRHAMGVDFELLRQRETLRIVSGTPLDSLVAASFGDGLKIGFLDTSLFAFVEALETIGDTSVVASPRVMCLNKQRAEILIGSELGYVSTTVTETAATQAVEFLEVGTALRIRPFVSSDGMIRMEVHPELSEGAVRVEQGFTLPDKDVTQVTTNIMCQSGATVVIGGLMREDLATNSTQIPVLGNLPMVGALFRQRSEEIDRREIIVLLTPKIVDAAAAFAAGDSAKQQLEDRRDVFRDKMSPLGKRHHGLRYLRLAMAAWTAGDADTALRYVNLSLHWDPLHQSAVNLRREILTLYPDLEFRVDEHLQRGTRLLDTPHRDYSRQGFPWQPPSETQLEIPLGEPVLEPIEALPEPSTNHRAPRSTRSAVHQARYVEQDARLKQPFGVHAQVTDQ